MTHLLGLALVSGAAALAGAVNSIAGGGTLLTFPALLALGVSPVAANATSTVALVPGSLSAFWAYRGAGGGDRATLLRWGIPSLLGGALGAVLVIRAGDSLFGRLVPWLLFGATGLFIVQEPLRRRFASKDDRPPSRAAELGTVVFQLFVATYGGFFGAGMGILMLAAMGLLGLRDLHQMNRLKTFAAVCINGVAAVTFAVGGQVRWETAVVMAVAAVLGGYSGARMAQRVGRDVVRWLVVAIGLSIGVVTLVRPP